MRLALQHAEAEMAKREMRERMLEAQMQTQQRALEAMEQRLAESAKMLMHMVTKDKEKPTTKVIKDLSSELLVKCPIDKTTSDVEQWMITLGANASGVHEKGSYLVKMLIAHDPTVLRTASSTAPARGGSSPRRQLFAARPWFTS